MKKTLILMDWSDTGCDMTVQLNPVSGLEMRCPVCDVVVDGHHQCGDRLPKPITPRRQNPKKVV